MTRKAASSKGIRTGVGLTRLYLDALHRLITGTVIEPWNHEIASERDELADVMWEHAIHWRHSPHLCPDRYCTCHLILADREPPTLF